MYFTEDQQGFDETFISEVPDYLKCVVCHLVLRKPIQIMKCGHRFCEPCFTRIKSYSESMNTELSCPIDRDLIDLTKVFEDTGIDRVIGDLTVQCVNNAAGCMWMGDLRNIKAHIEQCNYTSLQPVCNQPNFQECVQEVEEGRSSLLNELCQRMLKCENSLMEKEKDIVCLKFSLEELKKTFNEKVVEVDLLKNENKNMEQQLEVIKNQNQELKQDLMENELLFSEKPLIVEGVTAGSEDEQVMKEVKSVNNIVYDDLEIPSSEHLKDVTKLHQLLRKSLNKLSDKINELHSRVTCVEKEVEHKYNLLSSKVDQNLMQDSMKKIIDLKDHITNIENILFCDLSTGSEDIVLKWVLQNYQYHFAIGKAVYSPIFFTEMKGYCFRLKIGWTGKNNENLAVGLHLCLGRSYDKALEPFNMQYSIEMLDKDGNVLSEEIPLAEIEEYRKESSTIPPGKNCAQRACGNAKFLTMPSLENYIINDMLFIKCTLSSPDLNTSKSPIYC